MPRCFDHRLKGSYHFNGSDMLVGERTKRSAEVEYKCSLRHKHKAIPKGLTEVPGEIDSSFIPSQMHDSAGV